MPDQIGGHCLARKERQTKRFKDINERESVAIRWLFLPTRLIVVSTSIPVHNPGREVTVRLRITYPQESEQG